MSPSMTTTTTAPAGVSTSDIDISQGYDDEQIRLMEEVCIVIDQNDQPVRPGTKKECTIPIPHF
jgi:isopentenyl-diphosphate delta-isomerase